MQVNTRDTNRNSSANISNLLFLSFVNTNKEFIIKKGHQHILARKKQDAFQNKKKIDLFKKLTKA